MTKADILDALEELKVCTSYTINGVETNQVPFQMNNLNITPNFETFNGWNTDISNLNSFETSPKEMKNYIEYINKFLAVPVKFISNGPARDQIILT